MRKKRDKSTYVRKVKKADWPRIRAMFRAGVLAVDIGRRFGCTAKTIRRICKRRTKQVYERIPDNCQKRIKIRPEVYTKIFQLTEQGIGVASIALRFNVNQKTIRRILQEKKCP